MRTPEQRARKWLRLYPRSYRERRGEELLATMLERARDDPRIRLREIRSIAIHAGSLRLRQARPVTVAARVVVLSVVGVAIGMLVGPTGKPAPAVSWRSEHAALVAHDTLVVERDRSFEASHCRGASKSKDPDGCWVLPPGYISAPKDPNAPFVQIGTPTPPSTRSPQLAGTIGNMIQPVFGGYQYMIVNSWMETHGGDGEVVFAGALAGNAKQGVVVVVRTIGTVELPNSVRAYLTLAEDGALTLTAAHGLELTLRAADDTVYRFDARTDRYF